MTDLLFSLPIIFLLLASGALLLRRKSYTESYVNGVKEGIRILYGLFPSLLLFSFPPLFLSPFPSFSFFPFSPSFLRPFLSLLFLFIPKYFSRAI